MTAPLRERCEERLKKIADTKDEGYHAKWYAQDVEALLAKLDALEEHWDKLFDEGKS